MDTNKINTEIEKCLIAAKNFIEFNELMTNAKNNTKAEKYQESINLYEKAIKLNMKQNEIITELKDLKNIIDKITDEARNNAISLNSFDENDARPYKIKAAKFSQFSNKINKMIIEMQN